MKLMTYTMRFLTSILSKETTEDQIKKADLDEQNEKIASLEKKIETLEANLEEVSYCIQQLASTISIVITQITPSPKDPLDEVLKSHLDDDDKGYLH